MKEKVRKKNISNFIVSFLYSLSTLFLILVALPVYVFWLNSDDVAWQGSLWISLFLKSTIAAFVVALLISVSSNSLFRFYISAVIAVFLYIFVRAFFVPVSFGVLEGAGISEIPVFSDKSLWVSVILLIAFFLCARKYKKLCESITQISSLGLVLLSSYVFFSYNYASDSSQRVASQLGRFSKESNVIVLSFDSIQNDLLVETLSEHKDLVKNLDGFKLYSDVSSYAPNTIFSLLATLTGRYVKAGVKGDSIENLWEFYESKTMPSVLSKRGYEVDVYSSNQLCNLAQNWTCLNRAGVFPEDISIEYGLTAYDISALKVFPKSISWSAVQHLSRNMNDSDGDELSLISRDKAGHGFGLDRFVFSKMLDEIHLTDKPVFKFHHYLHSHQPIRFDENCTYDVAAEQDFEAAKMEIYCILTEFEKFITKLKEVGVYENSLIIFASDHGYESNIQPSYRNGKRYSGGLINSKGVWSASRYWPALLIKLPGSDGGLEVDNTPVSLIDVAPTIYDVLGFGLCGDTFCDGVSLSKRNVHPTRDRRAIFYIGGKDQIDKKHFDTRLFKSELVTGSVFRGIEEAIFRISLNDQYLGCNRNVNFSQEQKGYLSLGISDIESWGRWTDGTEAIILFNLNTAECAQNSLSLKLKGFVTEKNRKQQAKVLLNGVKIGEIVVNLRKRGPLAFEFGIPTELVKQDKMNVLEIRIDNPVSPSSVGVSDDKRLLGLGLESMIFR